MHVERGSKDDIGPLHHYLGLVHAYMGDTDAARGYFLSAIPLLEEHDAERLLAATYSNASLTSAEPEEFEMWAQRARATAAERGAIAQLTLCMANDSGHLVYAYGDYAGAARLLEEAISLEAREIGRADHLARLLQVQAYDFVNAGDLDRADEALAAARRALARRDTGADEEMGRYPAHNWARAHLHYARGDREGAAQIAAGNPSDLLSLELLCRLALEAGDLPRAQELVATLGTVRGYGYTHRARIHERAVEHLFSAELAVLEHHASVGSDSAVAGGKYRAAAAELLSALDLALTYTFAPLLPEVFVVAHLLNPQLCGLEPLALAASLSIGRHFVRRRAATLYAAAPTKLDDAQLEAWRELPPRVAAMLAERAARDVRERLADGEGARAQAR